MKIELGKTYTLVNGKTVRIVCKDRKSCTCYTIMGLVEMSDKEDVLYFADNGLCFTGGPWNIKPPTEKYVRLDDVIQFLKNRGHSERGGIITAAKDLPVKEIPE